jgi:predicted aldo/keto reductase-like oxidoreductase
MGPVGGGRLGEPSEILRGIVDGIDRVPQLAMRFVLANPNVDISLSGMSTMAQVEENIRVCADPKMLNPDEQAVIDEQLDLLGICIL